MRVVRVRGGLPWHALVLVGALLPLEDHLEEVLLELLVCKVDAELLKGVRFEVLEAENVKEPDGALGILGIVHGLVDAHYEIVEEAIIHGLG